MADRDSHDADSSEVHVAHCSACDRPVRVRLQQGFSDRDRPTAHDISYLICLDKGDDCTGAVCPFEEAEPDGPGKDPESATG